MNAIKNRALVGVLALGLTGLTACTGNPAPAAPAPDETIQELTEQVASLERALQRHVDRERHENDSLERQIDALSIFNRLEDVAEVDFVAFTGPPSHHEADPDDPGADNPLRIHAYTFVPRDLDRSGQHPLIVLPHGGVHSRFTSMYVPIVRELVEQGYSVIAPEYRGSTGYGSGFYRQIDYGGLEIQDTYAARNWMLDTYAFLDPDRVGLVGWSHGGLHALMNLFHYPDDYAVAYAGVPVSDLVERMRYKGERYHALYYVDYHIGTRVDEDRAEYERRSPAYQVHRYDGTPLLIHTTTNDDDVYVHEVQLLIDALERQGTPGWDYKIYQDAPGGHTFNRLNTPLARESRQEIYEFLAEHLDPPAGVANLTP